MSRPSRRTTTNSRGSSSPVHRSLSVNEALQSIRLAGTVGEYVASPSSYVTSDRRRRPPYRDEPSPYAPSPLEPTFSSSTLDPSVLDSRGHPTYSDSPSYSTHPTSSRSPYASGSATMRLVLCPVSVSSLANCISNSYQSYSQAPISNPYRVSAPSRSPSQYGKLRISLPHTFRCSHRLNEAGYSSAEASVSRSMSGPHIPSIPARTYEAVRNVGREFAERYPRRPNPRRAKKLIVRQTMLPSTSRSSQAEDVSGSIDHLLGHSGSSFDSNSPYAASSSHGAYGSGAISRYCCLLTIIVFHANTKQVTLRFCIYSTLRR